MKKMNTLAQQWIKAMGLLAWLAMSGSAVASGAEHVDTVGDVVAVESAQVESAEPEMPASASGQVNVNTADADALAKHLKGVGAAKAAAIVAFRDEYGPFMALEELTAVKGIGDATVARNAERIRF